MADITEMNLRVLETVSRYLNLCPALIQSENVHSVMECGIDENTAVAELFCAACGLDTVESPEAREIRNRYLIPSIQKLPAEVVTEDPYIRTVSFPDTGKNGWQFRKLQYKPYELFVRDDLLCEKDGREIPLLGYFDTAVSYPAVLQNGREWMTVTPNEIATISRAVRHARGKVVTFGLGLGYFAFGAGMKNEVSSVTVVEKDPTVIELFRRLILPQFPCREKIHIYCADAFDYAEHTLPGSDTDFVFADIWHDTLDGAPLYKRFKSLESLYPGIRCEYWIETSLITFLKGICEF